MKATVMFILLMGLSTQVFAQETIEVSPGEKEVVAQELEKEAANPKHDTKTKEMLKKVAREFKSSKKTDEVDITKTGDCQDCQKPQAQSSGLLKKIGRSLGKASAWLTTATARPFMNASGFLTGAFEKQDKNSDVVALYQFFLNHKEEFDPLYLEAGSPQEMVELMLTQSEEIMEKKSKIILRDVLLQLGIKKEIPQDLADFELTAEDIAGIDFSKMDVKLVNNHPEYAEVRPLLGDMTTQDLEDIVMLGYFDKAISFENMKGALPKAHEVATTIVSQVFVPNVVLSVVSSTLAGLYVAPVIAAQIGTGVSTAICLERSTQDKFEADEQLKSFCSYVTNRTAYQLMKSRAKGYVAGKNVRAKIQKKKEARLARKAAKMAGQKFKKDNSPM